MKVFYNPVQKTHILTHEIIAGKRYRHHEKKARLENILKHLRAAKRFDVCVPDTLPIEAVLAVHDEGYIRFLESSQMLSKEEVIWPYTFPNDRRLSIREPVTVFTAGYYCFDVGTPIMSDTYIAAMASASGAFAAAKHVLETGEACYALARPPGHHAASALFGGYCYINNAAIAAKFLSQEGRVLVIDFDFHHGNGTQSIFYDSNEVFYYSIHGDPSIEYPYFSGFAEEKGIGEGLGFNLNIPIEPMVGAAEYLGEFKEGLNQILKRFDPKYIVCSCGFDVAEGDPLGHFALTPEHFYELGTTIKSLGKPVTLIQEGGYLVDRLGVNVHAFLSAFL
ncbi:MAG: histone deacetylase family protein [Pseudomonadota bacterium]